MLKTAEASVQAAARALRAARAVVVTTGAGMSSDSGIPTFRDALTGLWARYDPEELATEAAFRRNPARVFGWYVWRRRLVRAAVPHAGYHALVALERIVPDLVVVTQNVDGLHRRVGSTHVVELHGSLERFSCLTARHPFPPDEVATPALDGECEPPRCPRCDAMLVVGTSGLVQPAAQLPLVAREAGAVVIEVNPEPTEISRAAHITCRGPAGAVLPALLAALTEGERPRFAAPRSSPRWGPRRARTRR